MLRNFGPTHGSSGSKAARLAASIFRPDSPQERTSFLRSGTSPKCQEATYAPQQRTYYSMTSSAVASIVGGTARPSVFAVLRLMTNSNFVG